ncbi:MAG: CAP domain-containing protein [Planctomycetes bacterium]|nr:CAP domain-containing protein [Planctomycetota bacterium]
MANPNLIVAMLAVRTGLVKQSEIEESFERWQSEAPGHSFSTQLLAEGKISLLEEQFLRNVAMRGLEASDVEGLTVTFKKTKEKLVSLHVRINDGKTKDDGIFECNGSPKKRGPRPGYEPPEKPSEKTSKKAKDEPAKKKKDEKENSKTLKAKAEVAEPEEEKPADAPEDQEELFEEEKRERKRHRNRDEDEGKNDRNEKPEKEKHEKHDKHPGKSIAHRTKGDGKTLVLYVESVGAAFTYEIPDGADCVRIGRVEEDNDICIPDEIKCSRYHAQVRKIDGTWRILDLKSSNGTRIAGEEINERPLRYLDVIEIGDSRITFGDKEYARTHRDDEVKVRQRWRKLNSPKVYVPVAALIFVAVGVLIFAQEYVAGVLASLTGVTEEVTISEEKIAYQKISALVSRVDKIEAYRRFMQEYPESEYSGDAKLQIRIIEDEIRREFEEDISALGRDIDGHLAKLSFARARTVLDDFIALNSKRKLELARVGIDLDETLRTKETELTGRLSQHYSGKVKQSQDCWIEGRDGAGQPLYDERGVVRIKDNPNFELASIVLLDLFEDVARTVHERRVARELEALRTVTEDYRAGQEVDLTSSSMSAEEGGGPVMSSEETIALLISTGDTFAQAYRFTDAVARYDEAAGLRTEPDPDAARRLDQLRLMKIVFDSMIQSINHGEFASFRAKFAEENSRMIPLRASDEEVEVQNMSRQQTERWSRVDPMQIGEWLRFTLEDRTRLPDRFRAMVFIMMEHNALPAAEWALAQLYLNLTEGAERQSNDGFLQTMLHKLPGFENEGRIEIVIKEGRFERPSERVVSQPPSVTNGGSGISPPPVAIDPSAALTDAEVLLAANNWLGAAAKLEGVTFRSGSREETKASDIRYGAAFIRGIIRVVNAGDASRARFGPRDSMRAMEADEESITVNMGGGGTRSSFKWKDFQPTFTLAIAKDGKRGLDADELRGMAVFSYRAGDDEAGMEALVQLRTLDSAAHRDWSAEMYRRGRNLPEGTEVVWYDAASRYMTRDEAVEFRDTERVPEWIRTFKSGFDEAEGSREKEASKAAWNSLARYCQRDANIAKEIAEFVSEKFERQLRNLRNASDPELIRTLRRQHQAYANTAIELINDETNYPTDYDKNDAGFIAHQRKIDDALKDVRKIWERPSEVVEELQPQRAEFVRSVTTSLGDIRAILQEADPQGEHWNKAEYGSLSMTEFPDKVIFSVHKEPLNSSDGRRLQTSYQIIEANEAYKEGELLSAEEYKLVELTNDYRLMLGVGAVAISEQLVQASRWHSDYMGEIGRIDHEIDGHPFGRDPLQRARRAGYTRRVGENLAWHPNGFDAQGALDGWQHSPGHHRNLLIADYNYIGVAAEKDKNRYWTQLFGY